MTDPQNLHAPGCFGSALTFKGDAPECATCSFAAACGPRSHAQLEKLREKFGIVVPRPAGAKTRAKPEKNFYMPVKVAAVLERVARSGVDVIGDVARNVNPFSQGPNFLALACHLMLKREVGVPRDMLITAMETQFNWTRATAAAHALQAVQALVALGVADEIDGSLVKRNGNV